MDILNKCIKKVDWIIARNWKCLYRNTKLNANFYVNSKWVVLLSSQYLFSLLGQEISVNSEKVKSNFLSFLSNDKLEKIIYDEITDEERRVLTKEQLKELEKKEY
jgi:uncharacterized membrane protein YheB (UPF0754 family)